MKLSAITTLAAVAAFADSVVAYSTFTPSTQSMTRTTTAPARSFARRSTIEMKKGKPNVPANMRSQFKQREDMQGQREAMQESQRPGPDGMPVFNLFVRSKKAQMWYPCGSFRGDDRSKALCMTYKDDGMMSGMSKNQLDSGVSGSLATDEKKLIESVVRGYPQLKKAVQGKDNNGLEWGYKLAFEGLSDEQKSMNMVVPEKQDPGVLGGVKSVLSSFLPQNQKGKNYEDYV
mmetsp:Transcript_48992/g.95795  ORF Transcript_48992/g.95795 Transcript_48992/m.95795 type:complete len:232 (+) Transcript_48992:134-829(+)